MDPSDEALLASARAGDREAMATLLQRHGAAARRAVNGRIPQRWRSVLSEDDLMQQTYADATMGLGQFEPRGEGSFPAWLSSLARCNLLDAIKMLETAKRGGDRRRVESPRSDESFVALYELLGATSRTPSRAAAATEARGVLGTALDQLPEASRQVIELYDLAGQPIESVAAELGRSEGAVYMLRARALQHLARAMGTASKFFTNAS